MIANLHLHFAFVHILLALMDVPPMFDISRLDIWKVMMSCHLKILGYKVYLAITKESYLSDSKHIEANALALKALRACLLYTSPSPRDS